MNDKTNIQNEVIRAHVEEVCRAAAGAKFALASASSAVKNKLLSTIAERIRAEIPTLLAANDRDMEAAAANGVPSVMLDRLRLTDARLMAIASSIEELIALPDPIGEGECFVRPNGLRIAKTRVPLGTVAVIYEARPNVTFDAAAICLKTGNSVVLRGGKEAINTNLAAVELIRRVLASLGLPEDAVSIIKMTDRAGADALMTMRKYIDVLIPRGGAGLIRSVTEKSSVPVIETGAGNCHVYIDRDADLEIALKVTENAKMSRPSVCNAAESLLVHRDIAEEFLPRFRALTEGRLELRGCAESCRILPGIAEATDEDHYTEYNDYIMSVKIVANTEEAIAHINEHGTRHSEAIITRSISTAEQFKRGVDAAAVYVNASTRFTDGGEFGLGAEIGISTQKLHVRGPMGLRALCSEKYTIDGNGQIR